MPADWMPADWPAHDSIVAGTTLRTYTDDALPIAGQPCWLTQVHGATVVDARDYDEPPAADASANPLGGVVCVVRTADCLPALFCSGDGRTVAAAHAGWRGLAAGVLENTVAALPCNASELMVWLGPAISQQHFEVGDEVRAAFTSHDTAANAFFAANERGRWQADLYGLARQRLSDAGVTAVYGGGLCTFADRRRFFSYRRDSDSGRMVSFVGRNID